MKRKFLIKDARLSKQITQQQMAAVLGISRSYYTELENGKYKIDVDLFLDIAEVLNICPCQLVENRCCENCKVPGKKYRLKNRQ